MLESEIAIGKGPHTIPALSRTWKLLVVDDDRSIQTVLSRALSLTGYDVNLARNGLEAMSLFLEGSYDLVITDLEMPFLTGLELSRLIKERSPETPVIVVTGSYDDNHWDKLKMNGVDAIIPKPFKLKEIGKTVQGLLNSGA